MVGLVKDHRRILANIVKRPAIDDLHAVAIHDINLIMVRDVHEHAPSVRLERHAFYVCGVKLEIGLLAEVGSVDHREHRLLHLYVLPPGNHERLVPLRIEYERVRTRHERYFLENLKIRAVEDFRHTLSAVSHKQPP